MDKIAEIKNKFLKWQDTFPHTGMQYMVEISDMTFLLLKIDRLQDELQKAKESHGKHNAEIMRLVIIRDKERNKVVESVQQEMKDAKREINRLERLRVSENHILDKRLMVNNILFEGLRNIHIKSKDDWSAAVALETLKEAGVRE